MAVVNSSTFNFAEVVRQFMTDYGYDVMDVVTESIDQVAKETVKKLKAASKKAVGGTGDYAKGWTRTLEKGRLVSFATVHGKKPTYQLAHLLEYGHVTKNGTGRTFPDTPGREHIKPVNDWAQDEAMERIMEKLEDLK